MQLLAIPLPAFDPVLLSIGPLTVRWYALAYIVGIFFGWWYARRLVANRALWGPKGSPMTPSDMDDFVIWATIGIVVGGRVGFVLFYDLPRFVEHPLEIFALWQGGMSFHGGFVGTTIAMILFARSRGIPAWSLIDVISPSVTMGLMLGRLANFVNGELWGRVTDVPWAFVFPLAGPEPRHPSQLYEAFLEGLLLFAILRVLTHVYRRLTTPGVVAGVFTAGYGTARIVSEFFREPDVHIGFLAGGLTMGMLLSVPMVVVGIAAAVWADRRAIPSSDRESGKA